MTRAKHELTEHEANIAKLTSYITSDLMFVALIRPEKATFKSSAAIAEEAIRRVRQFSEDGGVEDEIERQEWDPDE